MNKILLDTDVIINILKKDQKYIDKFLQLADTYIFYYNPIVLAEIYTGAFKKEIGNIEQFFDRLENIDICKYTGIQAGKYANQYRKAYNNISLEDYLIAANGKINSCKIWTNNKKHYPMDDVELI